MSYQTISSTRTQRQLTATQIVYIYIYICIYMKNFLFVFETQKSANNCAWARSYELLKTMTLVDFDVAFNIWVIKNKFLYFSLVSSVILSKRRLLYRNLSSNVVNFFGTLFGSRSSSSTCISDFFFERIFFTIPSSSFSSTYVTSKLFVISRTSLDILSRRSLVFCNWDFKISLRFFSFSPSSSLIILLVVLTSSSLLSSLCTEVVGVFF